MKRFVLHELTLLSRAEKSAFRLSFHPQVTVVRGENDTGKSTLLKSIFWCLGAEPAVVSDRWDRMDVCGSVRFSIGATTLTVVRHSRQFGVFDDSGKVHATFSGVTRGIGPYLAQRFGFGLLLNSKSTGQPEVPPPAYLLLPYYIDQDAGWQGTWCSFANLSQYERWKPDVAEYHLGLRDNRYYELKTAIATSRAQMEEPRREERALLNAASHVRSRFASMPLDFDLARFQKEIDELVSLAAGLSKDEEEYRRKMGLLVSRKVFIEQQVQLVIHAIRELNSDYDYALDRPADVECPTCGAHYENSVVERFRIARDEDTCVRLLTDLRVELATVDGQLAALKPRMNEAHDRNRAIWELLKVKRGTVSLHEILQGEARGQAIAALDEEVEKLRKRLGALEGAVREAQNVLSSIESPERKKDFQNRFFGTWDRYSVALRVSGPRQRRDFAPRIRETGSDLPRAVLAYHFAVLKFAWAKSDVAHPCLVIDSPNQQDQDAANLKTMLEFIRDHVPKSEQLILGLVDTQGVRFEGEEVVLHTKWKVLSSGLYPTLGPPLERLVTAMYQHASSDD